MILRLARRLRGRSGTALVLNLFAMVLFASLATVVFVGVRSQIKTTLYVERQAQAQAISEAGLEMAMNKIYSNSAWVTGFSGVSFASGTYTVTVTSGTSITVSATGYSSSLALTGAAVRTVKSVMTTTAGACPYAVMADDLVVQGKIDAYDATVTLTPCSTCFTAGANTWSNSGLRLDTGAACPPTRLRGIGYIGGSHSLTGGSSNCAESGVVTSTQTATLPNYSGASGSNLTVTSGSPLTLYPGTYNYNKITINSGGILTADTSTGTIYINYNSNFNLNSGCQLNNTSKIPSRLHVTDVSGNSGHTIDAACSTPLYAYVEGNVNRFTLEQEVYGHFCGGSVTISSTTGAIGLVHYDIGGGAITHVTPSSWQESYKRQ